MLVPDGESIYVSNKGYTTPVLEQIITRENQVEVETGLRIPIKRNSNHKLVELANFSSPRGYNENVKEMKNSDNVIEQTKEDKIPAVFESSSISLRTAPKPIEQDLSMRSALKRSNISIPSVSARSGGSQQRRENLDQNETEQLEQAPEVIIDEKNEESEESFEEVNVSNQHQIQARSSQFKGFDQNQLDMLTQIRLQNHRNCLDDSSSEEESEYGQEIQSCSDSEIMGAAEGHGGESAEMGHSDLPPVNSQQAHEPEEPEFDLGGFNMDDIIKANNRNLGRYDNVDLEHQNNDELFNELVVEEDDVDFESEEMQALHFTSNKALGRIDSSEDMVETPPMESPDGNDGAAENNG